MQFQQKDIAFFKTVTYHKIMTIPLADIVYAISLLIIIFIIRMLSTDPERRSLAKITVQSLVILFIFLLIPRFYSLIQEQMGELGSTIALLGFAAVFAWYCYYQYKMVLKAQHRLDRKYKGIIRELKKEENS